MMTGLEGTVWYLMFLGEIKACRSGENAAGVRREIETESEITDADVQGHRFHERRIGREVGAMIEIGANGNGMTVTDFAYVSSLGEIH
jgi:hypothetical protein